MSRKNKKKISEDIIAEKNGVQLYKGSVEGGNTMFFKIALGEAKDPETGTIYELTTNVGSGAPMITNNKTGRIVLFSWHGLIKQAIALGIDETSTGSKTERKRT